mmetsp:Transcript_8499/g.10734  ORF Transcript_8499/g.10734 Transcript_8499/m.10734 type:complete len:113 (+) Transcript_8499:61-399(+)
MRLHPLLAFGYCKHSRLSRHFRPPHLDHTTRLAMSDSAKLPRVDFDSTETVGSTRWMRLETLSYHVANENPTDGSGSSVRKWDRAVRTTKVGEATSMKMLAILYHQSIQQTH